MNRKKKFVYLYDYPKMDSVKKKHVPKILGILNRTGDVDASLVSLDEILDYDLASVDLLMLSSSLDHDNQFKKTLKVKLDEENLNFRCIIYLDK